VNKRPVEVASAFRDIPYMGVIWVVAEAMKKGFYNGHPDWSNLGQGQPEVGDIAGSPSRITHFSIEPGDQAYGPINGMQELRESVADHYNRLYRQNCTSKYTAENVTIAMGGRLALSRIFASLGVMRLGYQVPDYPAYEDMIRYQEGRVTAINIPTSKENGFGIPCTIFGNEIESHDLDGFIFSNPCNPTGNLIEGDELSAYVSAAREHNCSLIVDEFYSHFTYNETLPGDGPVSVAQYVDHVDHDPVVLVDGLTKSFRYPGWRIGWTVGPKQMIETLGCATSAIDGGASQPMQRAALQVLEPQRADQETNALRQVFSKKRNIMVNSLAEMGIKCFPTPKGAFYAWADIGNLPEPINNATHFFEHGLNEQVLTVPGYFFDINSNQTAKEDSVFNQWIRFSFGPPEDNMKMGLERLAKMVKSF